LAHHTHVGLPQYFIQREAAHAFIDGIWDHEVKFSILMGGERMLKDALNQALELECPWDHGHQGLEATVLGNLYASSVGASAISGVYADSNIPRRTPWKEVD
jgi:hypothetical protein